MFSEDQKTNARRTFNNQVGIIRSHIRVRKFDEVRDFMFTLAGMVTMVESVDGYNMPFAVGLRHEYQTLWDNLVKAKQDDVRRTHLEDAC